jgi:DNA-binding MarR family transcriptional regulator
MRKISQTRKADAEIAVARRVLDTVPRAMRAVRRQFRSIDDSPITLTQMRLLARLERGLTTTAALAESMGVTLPAITHMVSSLVRRRLVSRQTSTEDRRQAHITTTAKGRAALTAARRSLQTRFVEGCRQLDHDDQDKLLAGLEVLERLALLLDEDD